MKDSHKLSEEDGEFLVKTARKVVLEFLVNGIKIKLDDEYEKKFSFNSGVNFCRFLI